jgi:hypothetical protein
MAQRKEYVEVKNFLTKTFCKTVIDRFEELRPYTFTFRNRQILRCLEDENDNDKVVKKIITKVKNYFDSKYKDHLLRNLEIVQWNIGEKHLEHVDIEFYDYTFIINLCDNYKGARTYVKSQKIEPKTGKLIYFNAELPHNVSELTEGKRYVIVGWYNHIDSKKL